MMAVFVALTLAVSLVIALTIASRLLVICAPRELLLIMGRRTAETTRYSVLRNGRVLRIPGFQRVFRLPLGVFEVPFSVHSCDQHHVPVALSGVAALRIGGDDASIARAATRLLGLDQAALTTLGERMVRAAIAGVTPQLDAVQLVEEPRWSEEQMVLEVEARIEELGLKLEALRIEDVRDDAGYIEARQALRRARA